MRLAAVFAALMLAGCSLGPTKDQTVAACQLDAERIYPVGTPNTVDPTSGLIETRDRSVRNYVTTCMQARGFRPDEHSKGCIVDESWALEGACYSRDRNSN